MHFCFTTIHKHFSLLSLPLTFFRFNGKNSYLPLTFFRFNGKNFENQHFQRNNGHSINNSIQMSPPQMIDHRVIMVPPLRWLKPQALTQEQKRLMAVGMMKVGITDKRISSLVGITER